MNVKAKITEQVNFSPEPLRSYIHELEFANGNVALLIKDNFELEENINGLIAYVKALNLSID